METKDLAGETPKQNTTGTVMATVAAMVFIGIFGGAALGIGYMVYDTVRPRTAFERAYKRAADEDYYRRQARLAEDEIIRQENERIRAEGLRADYWNKR